MQNKKARVLLEALGLAPDGLIVEIGCVRQDHEVPEDGYSTVYLARYAREKGCSFKSFDNEQQTVYLANRLLNQEGFLPLVECIDGVDALTQETEPIVFLYLDSHRDPQFSMDQYLAAELAPGAIVAIDDTHAYEQWEYGKATNLIALAVARELPFDIVPTFSNQQYQTAMTIIQIPDGKAKGGR